MFVAEQKGRLLQQQPTYSVIDEIVLYPCLIRHRGVLRLVEPALQ